MEEKDLFSGTISMKRLQYKAKLIKDCSVIFQGLSKYKEVLPSKFKKRAEKSVLSDFLRGLRQISKKCGVFVELPKIESVGNGMVREIDTKTKEPVSNEITVSDYQTQIENDMSTVFLSESSDESNTTVF